MTPWFDFWFFTALNLQPTLRLFIFSFKWSRQARLIGKKNAFLETFALLWCQNVLISLPGCCKHYSSRHNIKQPSAQRWYWWTFVITVEFTNKTLMKGNHTIMGELLNIQCQVLFKISVNRESLEVEKYWSLKNIYTDGWIFVVFPVSNYTQAAAPTSFISPSFFVLLIQDPKTMFLYTFPSKSRKVI